MEKNTEKRQVSPLDQFEEEDFYLLAALFNQFIEGKEELEEVYNPLKKRYADHIGIEENSPFALMFTTFVAGFEKGLGLMMNIEEREAQKAK